MRKKNYALTHPDTDHTRFTAMQKITQIQKNLNSDSDR